MMQSYVERNISLVDLFQSLSFKTSKFLGELKQKVNGMQENFGFALYYPVFLSHEKKIQQSALTFSCELLKDSYQINKIYVNKDILALLVAQQKAIEVADVRALYEQQMNEVASAVDALSPSNSFEALYRVVCEEFSRIFNADLTKFQNTKEWQMLEKAVISFELPESAVDNCFRDELGSMKRCYLQDSILPGTVQRYLEISRTEAINVKTVACTASHLGSYQAEYPVNKKQWQLVQLAKHAELLCVEGPPGTGKTTLLKEMVADILVEKANSLIAVWDNAWEEMGDAGKGISRSPLQGKNLNSILISSTNNKAIDNIGLELLQEVPYFSQFAKTMESAEGHCAGILCARLGNGRNIREFYTTLFMPFCKYFKYAVNRRW